MAETTNAKNNRLVTSIDCTREYPADQYFAYGEVGVVDGPAGRYREANGKQFSRFGYRFRIKNIGKPHVMIVRYPDDKRRFMFAIDGTCYDLSTAIVTGFAHPLSGQMLELKNVFWPRWEDCRITFMTWGHGDFARDLALRTRQQKAIACWLEPERLLNSRSGTIFFFPCVPSGFDVAFRDFQARGGFRVSGEYRGGEVTYASITARRDGPCAVMNPWPDRSLRVLEQPGNTPVNVTQTGAKCRFLARAGCTHLANKELTCERISS